jgi:tetratricopeptide (TPR) repeat protein
MKQFFGSLFGSHSRPKIPPVIAKAPLPVIPRSQPADFYQQGDVIGGRFEVRGILGKGGFGVVYLVSDRDTAEVCALKTFRDELLADATARDAFKKEALLWVNLEEHPFILAARWVTEVFGRLFVRMDYMAHDDKGRVSLADHLARAGGPINADQTLKWAVQFCLGMEHAQTHGIKFHRDIKPANILITQDGTLKISDFGLAAAAEVAWRGRAGRGDSLVTGGPEGSFGLSLIQTGGKARCGTPGYMAPEIYRGEGADIRSDIYSFGLVLWQMAAGRTAPPFVVPYRGDLEGYLREIYEQQMTGRVPRVDGFLGPVIERCLSPKPAERYGSFGELRGALEPILERRTGKKLQMPQAGEKTADYWVRKGSSLTALGRREEAINCFDQALAIDPREAMTWNNKGVSLYRLDRHEEAINCFDQALAIDPQHAMAWTNKGGSLAALGRWEEAINCFDQALAVDPRNAMLWSNKGAALSGLGRREEAIRCYDQALAIDPRDFSAWFNKGNALTDLDRREEAIRCYDQALAIDPRYAAAWHKKGDALAALGRREEAIGCYNHTLAIDPRDAAAWNNNGNALAALGRLEEAVICYDQVLAIDPRYAAAWSNKGGSLAALCRREEAINCFAQALAIDPRDFSAWSNKGYALDDIGRREEAINCYDQALAIDPRNAHVWSKKGYALADLGRHEDAIKCFDQVLAVDPRNAAAWNNKARSEDALGRRREAELSYRKFIELAPPQYAEFSAQARQRLLELESKTT